MTGTPQADALLTALISGDPQIEDFADLTDEHEHEKALHVLLALLTDPDAHLREYAAKALGALGNQRAIEPLLRTFERYDRLEMDLLDATLNAVLDLGDVEVVLPLLTHSDITPSQQSRVMARFDKSDLLSVLRNGVTHPETIIRGSVLRALRYFNDPWSIHTLIRALDDSDEHIRAQSAYLLRQMRVIEAVPFLIPLTTDFYPRVRRLTAVALGKLGDSQAIPALLLMLKDAEQTNRMYAAIALAVLGDATGIAHVHMLLATGVLHNANLNYVIKMLRLVPNPVVPLLIELANASLDEAEPALKGRTQVEVLEPLVEIFAKASDPAALPVLERMLETNNEVIQLAVEQAIARINAQLG
jgi:HEAT repeat protein